MGCPLAVEVRDGLYFDHFVTPHWYYTDNRPGTGDERRVVVTHPHQLSCRWSSQALARAAAVCDEPLRSQARVLAQRYWALETQVPTLYSKEEQDRWQRDAKDLRVVAARLSASVELWQLTGEKKYADDAAHTADAVLAFQERNADEKQGLTGYFYRTLGQDEPYTGVGGKSLDAPGKALADVLLAMPDHLHAAEWREALRRYAEGTLKRLARANRPYGCVAAGPFRRPATDLFPGERQGALIVYPLHVLSALRRDTERLQYDAAGSQLALATQLAAMASALNDAELLRMAEGAVRYVLGANPFHVSLMRHFGDRWPVNAQLPDVPGMMVGWMGITSQGLPFFDPLGPGRLDGPQRFIAKEGKPVFDLQAVVRSPLELNSVRG